MDITPLAPAGRQVIEGYGPGRFRIGGLTLTGSVIVFPDRVVPWRAANVAQIDLASLEPVVTAGRGADGGEIVELLLIGCGSRSAPMPATLRKQLRDAGIVVDAMDTGAACRTYNVLLTEGRRVAAALLALA